MTVDTSAVTPKMRASLTWLMISSWSLAMARTSSFALRCSTSSWPARDLARILRRPAGSALEDEKEARAERAVRQVRERVLARLVRARGRAGRGDNCTKNHERQEEQRPRRRPAPELSRVARQEQQEELRERRRGDDDDQQQIDLRPALVAQAERAQHRPRLDPSDRVRRRRVEADLPNAGASSSTKQKAAPGNARGGSRGAGLDSAASGARASSTRGASGSCGAPSPPGIRRRTARSRGR